MAVLFRRTKRQPCRQELLASLMPEPPNQPKGEQDGAETPPGYLRRLKTCNVASHHTLRIIPHPNASFHAILLLSRISGTESEAG